MARTVRDARLDSRTARNSLKIQSKPYYRSLDRGLHLGYRRGETSGTWVVRVYVGGGSYRVERLGIADDKADADGIAVLNFSQAQKAARKAHVKIEREGQGLPDAGPYTVSRAINDYIEWKEQRRQSGEDARCSADAFILPKLGHVQCDKLTTPQLNRWLHDLASAPPRLRTAGGRQKHREVDMSATETKRRRQATANRILTVLKAALNHAWRQGNVSSDTAWRRVKPFENVTVARARFLTADECRRLMNASPAPFRDLVQAALLTGCRYSELAALRVDDFNISAGTVTIRTSKTGQGRHVVLTDEGVQFFKALTLGRLGAALMLSRPNAGPPKRPIGKAVREAAQNDDRWRKSFQVRPMKAACKAARIIPPISFHGLRHTWASLSIANGMPLMVAAKNLGHADTRMVELHYGHLAPSYISDTVRSMAPKFDIVPNTQVVGLHRNAA
jgi:integrase